MKNKCNVLKKAPEIDKWLEDYVIEIFEAKYSNQKIVKLCKSRRSDILKGEFFSITNCKCKRCLAECLNEKKNPTKFDHNMLRL